MDESAAIELLGVMMARKALYLITNIHACFNWQPGHPGRGNPVTAEEIAACAAYPIPMLMPQHFHLEKVVRLELPGPEGTYKAYSEEGSYVSFSSAADLLQHLMKPLNTKDYAENLIATAQLAKDGSS